MNGEEEHKKTWVDYNDMGDHDPEMYQIRKEMRDGVLSYDNYLKKKGILL